MRVLIVHNRYREPGGEDSVVQAETEMLRSNDVEVEHLDFSNDVPEKGRLKAELIQLLQSSWSAQAYRRTQDACAQFRPDVMHVHNFWMQASPAIHSAAGAMQVATIQTLHNFRLLCPNAKLLRNGRVCEDCVGKVPWRGVLRKCYRDSAVASAATGSMICFNRLRGTWRRDVDAFIALTAHAREKFVIGGLPPDRIFVKPNFANFNLSRSAKPSSSRTYVYVGRLSEEKGVDILLRAWATRNLSGLGKLLIIGDGPRRGELQALASSLKLSPENTVFLGYVDPSEISRYLSESRFLVLPSICYETFGMTILEAGAAGRPAIASRIGALPEIVQEGVTGLLFTPGDEGALAQQLEQMMMDDVLVDRLGATAQQVFSSTFTPDQNFGTLMSIYRFALENKSRAIPNYLDQFPVAKIGMKSTSKAF